MGINNKQDETFKTAILSDYDLDNKADKKEDKPKEKKEEKKEDPSHNYLWVSLDYIESFLWLIFVGSIRFIFIKVPDWIFNFLVNWFSTLFKLFKVTALFLMVIFIIIFPGYYSLYVGSKICIIENICIPSNNKLGSHLTISFCLWSVFAVAGSFWGLMKIKIKRNTLISAIRAIFLKKYEK